MWRTVWKIFKTLLNVVKNGEISTCRRLLWFKRKIRVQNGTLTSILFLHKSMPLFRDAQSWERSVKASFSSLEEEKIHKFHNLVVQKDLKLWLFLKKLNKISWKILKKLEAQIRIKSLMCDLVDGTKISMPLRLGWKISMLCTRISLIQLLNQSPLCNKV